LFQNFILSGNEVMKQLLLLIMKVAPIGLGAYFAYQVGTIGPQLFGFYAKPLGLYYIRNYLLHRIFQSLCFYLEIRKWRKSFLERKSFTHCNCYQYVQQSGDNACCD
jgi:Na+/H+-dicarboxylate symporter